MGFISATASKIASGGGGGNGGYMTASKLGDGESLPRRDRQRDPTGMLDGLGRI